VVQLTPLAASAVLRRSLTRSPLTTILHFAPWVSLLSPGRARSLAERSRHSISAPSDGLVLQSSFWNRPENSFAIPNLSVLSSAKPRTSRSYRSTFRLSSSKSTYPVLRSKPGPLFGRHESAATVSGLRTIADISWTIIPSPANHYRRDVSIF